MNTTTNIVTTQAVIATLRKAGLTMGRDLSSTLGWVAKSVDKNGIPSAKINGRVVRPAEAVRLSFNCRGYDFAMAKREAQLTTAIAALTAKGLTVTQVGETKVWLVRAN